MKTFTKIVAIVLAAAIVAVVCGAQNQNVDTTANVAFQKITYTAAIGADLAISGSNIDCSLGNSFYKTLAAATPFLLQNQSNGQIVIVHVSNPSTFAVTFTGVDKWQNNVTPTQTANATDIYTFDKSNGTNRGIVCTNL